MATSTEAAGQENHLQRKVGLRGMTLVSLGSIIGSGWLFGALGAAKLAGGGGSLLTWIFGALVLLLLALVHAELGSTYRSPAEQRASRYMIFRRHRRLHRRVDGLHPGRHDRPDRGRGFAEPP